MRRVRMIDVAKAAKVSMTTASYVLNHRDVQIPEETRKRIWDAARNLDYQPNRMAQNLAHQRTGLIGVLTPISWSPFHAQLTGELSARASDLSYTLIFESIIGQDKREGTLQEAINRLLQWRVDGLLLWCQDLIPPVLLDCPTVLMGPRRSYPDDRSYVQVDLYEGTKQAAEYLVSLGHDRICFVGHADKDNDPRWQALFDVTTSAGLPQPDLLVESDHADETRNSVEATAMSGHCATAFFCISDVQALYVFRGLRNAGLRVPEDKSIVSCDESWVAENFDPPLTSVAVPFRSMAESALVSLIEIISSGRKEPIQSVLMPQLRIRGSAAPPPH